MTMTIMFLNLNHTEATISNTKLDDKSDWLAVTKQLHRIGEKKLIDCK